MSEQDALRNAIETGNTDSVSTLLAINPALANSTIVWGEGQKNKTDPLHYVSDCVFNGHLENGEEVSISNLLLSAGASIEGNAGRETPLLGATSLGVETVANLLIDYGADPSRTSLFGGTALHWAAYAGIPSTVKRLLHHGACLEQRCTEFGATPLFWAVQGFSRHGPRNKKDQPGAASVLLDAGARVATSNMDGTSILERAADSDSNEMLELLKRYTDN